MTAATHCTFAVASSLATVLAIGPVFHWYYSIPILLGALAPDLDSRRTAIHTPSRIAAGMLPRSFAVLLDFFAGVLGFIVRMLVPHRGILHSPFVCICLFCLAYSLNSGLLFWFSFAYAGHVVLDFCTRGGIQFFSPLSNKTYSAIAIRTGSFAEIVFCAILLWYLAYTSFALYRQTIESVVRFPS